MKATIIDWFFLSGGYGILNALEPVVKYQATFSKGIHYQKKIPFTAKKWDNTLTDICESIIKKHNSKNVYVFGSRDYTAFIKKTCFWNSINEEEKTVKIFKSTGNSGTTWLSKIIGELATHIEKDTCNKFDNKYPLFLKQAK